jgi:glycosyltransferase involved in cell wall biosynthesis
MEPQENRTKGPIGVPAGVREEIDVTFFVPCLNEEPRIAATLGTLFDAMSGSSLSYEVIVVDDGSTDRTAEVVRDYSRSHPESPLQLISNKVNLGLARCFVDTAFQGRGRHYRLICGDNIEPKESISAILARIGDADIVIPYYPEVPGKGPIRLALSNFFTTVVNLASGHVLRYYNGNPLYRRYDVMRWAPHNYGFGYQADILTQLLDQGASFVEIPVVGMHRAKDGGSSVRVRNLLSVAHSLLEIVIRRIRRALFAR